MNSNNYVLSQTKSFLHRNINKEEYLPFPIFFPLHIGHQEQDGGKVGQMSLFFKKSEVARDREKQKFIHFQFLISNLS